MEQAECVGGIPSLRRISYMDLFERQRISGYKKLHLRGSGDALECHRPRSAPKAQKEIFTLKSELVRGTITSEERISLLWNRMYSRPSISHDARYSGGIEIVQTRLRSDDDDKCSQAPTILLNKWGNRTLNTDSWDKNRITKDFTNLLSTQIIRRNEGQSTTGRSTVLSNKSDFNCFALGEC